VTDLKKLVGDLMQKGPQSREFHDDNAQIIKKLYSTIETDETDEPTEGVFVPKADVGQIQDTEEIVEESLSLENKEIEMIRKALEKHFGKRKYAADDLGISERTLYRKIKEYNIE
jgi:transcriptional regulator with PAS, ATPase and Fis domain